MAKYNAIYEGRLPRGLHHGRVSNQRNYGYYINAGRGTAFSITSMLALLKIFYGKIFHKS